MAYELSSIKYAQNSTFAVLYENSDSKERKENNGEAWIYGQMVTGGNFNIITVCNIPKKPLNMARVHFWDCVNSRPISPLNKTNGKNNWLHRN